MRSVNRVILLGNLGRDAETNFTPGGTSVTKFSVATTRRWKDRDSDEWKEETNWTNVVLWRQENLGQYLQKGKQVYVEGRLQTRSYDDKDGKKIYATEVVAEEVILLGGQANGASEGTATRVSQPARRTAPVARAKSTDDQFGGMGVTDEDIPF